MIAFLLRLSVSFLRPIEQPLPDIIWTCSTYPVTQGWHRVELRYQHQRWEKIPHSKSDSAKKERPTLIVRNA